MSYKVELTSLAKSDISGIFNYIKIQLQEPKTAEKQYIKIKKSIQSLAELPERCALYSDEPWRGRGLRKLSVGNYLVFYVVDNDTVTIIRVMYAGRDISAQLKDTDYNRHKN